MNYNDILCVLGDCYANNKPFDYKLLPQDDWNKFAEEFEVKAFPPGDYDLTNNPSKEEIFDFAYEATGYYEFDEETICSFGNLSLVLMTNTDFANFIIENKIEFKEFIREPYKRSSIEQIEFSDVLYHFNGSFENWQTDTSIIDGSLLVSLCDYLGIKIETIGETPAKWNVPEYEFEEFESKDDLEKFARLFSKPMNKWYGDRWCDI